MHSTSRVMMSAALLPLAVALAACGDAGTRNGQAEDAAAVAQQDAAAETGTAPISGGGGVPSCLSAAEISSAVGAEMNAAAEETQISAEVASCGYVSAGDPIRGFGVRTVMAPASEGERAFSQFEQSVKEDLGPAARPEVLSLGERGLAYGSPKRSAAAVIAGNRFYHAELTSGEEVGDRKSAMIEIVRKLMAQ